MSDFAFRKSNKHDPIVHRAEWFDAGEGFHRYSVHNTKEEAHEELRKRHAEVHPHTGNVSSVKSSEAHNYPEDTDIPEDWHPG